jgi:hypothetical protein
MVAAEVRAGGPRQREGEQVFCRVGGMRVVRTAPATRIGGVQDASNLADASIESDRESVQRCDTDDNHSTATDPALQGNGSGVERIAEGEHGRAGTGRRCRLGRATAAQ